MSATFSHTAKVTKVVSQNACTNTVYFTVNGAVLPFTAGQYISVYFDDLPVRAGKAYSLCSTPWDPAMAITVKAIGPYSQRLCALQPGDAFLISSPYGFFNVRNNTPIVALAAGVGISPVWSIIRDELHASKQRDVRLLHTAHTNDDLVFHSPIKQLFAKHPNATYIPFVTSGKRRLSVDTDITKDELAKATFYLCGSQGFVTSLWRQLAEAGVDETRVATEIFFEKSAE